MLVELTNVIFTLNHGQVLEILVTALLESIYLFIKTKLQSTMHMIRTYLNNLHPGQIYKYVKAKPTLILAKSDPNDPDSQPGCIAVMHVCI